MMKFALTLLVALVAAIALPIILIFGSAIITYVIGIALVLIVGCIYIMVGILPIILIGAGVAGLTWVIFKLSDYEI